MSARISPAQLQQFVAARLPALVLVTQCNSVIITDFVHAAGDDAHSEAPTVLICDAIELGQGKARLWTEGNTLHIRAHNIDVMAHGEQRLRGATVHVG